MVWLWRAPIQVLHDVVQVPEDRVVVEVGGGGEPEQDSLLALAMAAGEHIRLQDQWLPARVPQEFEVQLVVVVSDRRELNENHIKENQHRRSSDFLIIIIIIIIIIIKTP